MAHVSARFFRRAEVVEEIGNLMTRLVAVPIAQLAEHGIKLRLRPLPASEHREQSLGIVRHIPCVMAWGTFSNGRIECERIGSGDKPAVGMTTVGITKHRVNHILPVAGAAEQNRLVIFFLQQGCYAGQSEIIKGIFECP